MIRLKPLLCFLFIVIFSNLHAQNFLINEDFSSANDTVPPKGWSNLTMSGDASVDKFQFSTKVFNFAKPLVKNWAVMDCYNGGSPGGTATNGQGEEVQLKSPVVSTNGLSNLTLSVDKQFFVQTGAAAYIEVSTDGGSSWTAVLSQTTALVEGSPSNVLINLNSYTGYSKFCIRFRWYNSVTTSYLGFFALDNVQLFERKSIDTRVTSIVQMYDNSCPSATQPLNVVVYNAGTTAQSKVPVVLKIGSTTLYDTAINLAANTSTNLFTKQTFNASAGGAFQFEAYTNLSTDLVKSNDTLKTTRSSSPPPAVPNGGNVNQCGIGSATLTSNRNKGDSTYWFSQVSGGTELGTGVPFITAPIDKTTTFYVENSRVTQNKIESSAGLYRFNGAIQPGSFFNVEAKNDVLIDSLSQHFAYSGNYTMTVYYRAGTYSGFETNTSAWTKLDLVKDTINVNGYGRFYVLRLKKPLRIPTGSTYGFYIHASTSSITFTNGVLDEQNADVRITGNVVTSASFNGVTGGYYWNGQLFFRKTCSTGRKAVTVNVIPRPKGSQLIKGTVYNGNFRAGTQVNFDVAAVKRTVSYELLPPSAYANSDFGTKWGITQFDMTTVNGTPIPTKDTTSTVPGGSNGKLSYTPSVGWEDSMILITLKLVDVKTGCDTLITRYIFIAPTPKSSFEAPNVCLGTSIEFDNISKISSGFLTYHWSFGDGDSSTFESPIHTYSQYGKYNVKLTSTSNYGIVSDTTILIEVYEIPIVNFKVTNACENVNLEFKNATTISSGSLAFNWNFGDGSKSTAVNPFHKFAKPGGYQVTLTADANGCTSSLTKFATQFDRPKAAFSSSGGCVGQDIPFVNNSTLSSGEKIGSTWYFDDGTKGTEYNPNHIYSSSGTKMVKLVAVSQFGCEDSSTNSIVIKASPVANFTYDKSCSVDPVNFTNLTSEPAGVKTIYSWSFGDGETSTQANPSHKYKLLGRVPIKLVAAADNGCSQEIIKEITVLVQPDVDFDINNACSSEPVVLTNKSKVTRGDIKYKWFFGDGDSSTFVSPVKIYDVNSTTIFVIRLEATVQGGCENSLTKNVTIGEKPECGFKVEQSKTDRRTFTFIPNNATYGDASYTWIFKGSGVVKTTSPTHTFDYNEQDYNVLLDIDVDGCSCFDSTTYLTTSWPLNSPQFEVEANNYQIFPNPSAGIITIQRNSDHSNTQNTLINVYGSDGKLVAQISHMFDLDSAHQIDLGYLSSGIYHIEIGDEVGRSTHRMTITR